MQILNTFLWKKKMNKSIEIDGAFFTGAAIATPNATLLVITGANGLLGCGYLSVATANKLNDALAVVRGVANFDDMLAAAVCEVSDAAAKLGVTVGMSGLDALKLMK